MLLGWRVQGVGPQGQQGVVAIVAAGVDKWAEGGTKWVCRCGEIEWGGHALHN